MAVAKGLGYASWAVAIRDLSLPGAWGPNFAHIVLDNWGLLSHCLFDETRVESKLSSYGAQYVGKGPSLGHTPCILGESSTFPGYVASWLRLKFVPWLLGRWSREGLDDETWILNTSFFSLSLLVSWSKACACRSLSCYRLSILSHQLK